MSFRTIGEVRRIRNMSSIFAVFELSGVVNSISTGVPAAIDTGADAIALSAGATAVTCAAADRGETATNAANTAAQK